MSDSFKTPPRAQRMLDRIDDPQRRETIACSLQAHSRPDRLSTGDPPPDLKLLRLAGDGEVGLTDYVGDRPLVLVFGSYT